LTDKLTQLKSTKQLPCAILALCIGWIRFIRPSPVVFKCRANATGARRHLLLANQIDWLFNESAQVMSKGYLLPNRQPIVHVSWRGIRDEADEFVVARIGHALATPRDGTRWWPDRL